jgi:allophanate hydrolase subunit 1
MEVPAGCISIGGQQTLVGGPSMPSGWNLIGQTPERLFAPDRENAFLLAAGDRVSFRAIEQDEFERLAEQAEDGQCVTRELPWT